MCHCPELTLKARSSRLLGLTQFPQRPLHYLKSHFTQYNGEENADAQYVSSTHKVGPMEGTVRSLAQTPGWLGCEIVTVSCNSDNEPLNAGSS